jgi:hypothetical protein
MGLSTKSLFWSLWAAALLLHIALWLVAYFVFPRQLPAAILHYSHDHGIDFVAPGDQILKLPWGGLALFATNIVLTYVLRPVSSRARWLIISANPVVQAILLTALIVLWRINVT